MNEFEFATTQRIISQPNCVSRVPQLCRQFAAKNPMIVTDPGIISVGLLNTLTDHMSGLDFTVFSEVTQDPPDSMIAQAAEIAVANSADLIIGFGGGSSMDTAKVIAVLAKQKQSLDTLYGVDQIYSDRLPLVLVPTTAGTGSEVTPIAIVTTGATTKAGIVSSVLLPDVALLDAGLTLQLPAHVTAATGIDAMVHAIEAFTSKIKKNIYSDMLALRALRLLSANIQVATFEPDNLPARQNMLVGSCLAGQAFANAPVAAVHALAYPLGGHFHIPHGLSNALVLPYVMAFNAPAASHLYAELAKVILPSEQLVGDDFQLTQHLVEYFREQTGVLGLPDSLRKLDIGPDDLPMLAKDALLQTRLLINNPREVSYQDALSIYQEAW